MERAAPLRKEGRRAGSLDGYTWHSNRHTFASRLAAARTYPELAEASEVAQAVVV